MGGETRTILVHVNVEVLADDSRSADEVADAVLDALEVGADDESVATWKFTVPLAEEIQ